MAQNVSFKYIYSNFQKKNYNNKNHKVVRI